MGSTSSDSRSVGSSGAASARRAPARSRRGPRALASAPPSACRGNTPTRCSSFAACYGPFNVRNEVDLHDDVVGGHFNNSHFLTGDGGFLQALINGFGGLRVAPGDGDGLALFSPALPEGAEALRLTGLHYRGLVFDWVLTPEAFSVSLAAASSKEGEGAARG